MERNKKKNRIFIILILIFAGMFIIGYFGFYRPIVHYIDTHTWATVAANGSGYNEQNGENVEFHNTEEILKGDYFDTEFALLYIEEVTHEGTVNFTVYSGCLYDADGNAVASDTLYLNQEKKYYSDKGKCCSICVTSNRYE